MSVYFCSDLHFGHKNIQIFRKQFSSEEENRKRIVSDWNSIVTKRDTVYVLGDACFTMDTIGEFGNLPGRKILIRGNHDLLDTNVYSKYFEDIYGLLKYKEFWLSHAPIHPSELRGRVNLHGHVHYSSIRLPWDESMGIKEEPPLDPYYLNCCCENFWNVFGNCVVSLESIRNYVKTYT